MGMTKQRIVIVDNDDRIVGHKESGTLASKDIYRVSALWITNSHNEILLAQRQLSKHHDPGKWGPAVAGTVEEGETYEANILKEAEEEIGLTGINPTLGPKRRVSGEHNYFCQWYTLVIDKPAQDFTLQEEEVSQVKWFTREELANELHNHPQHYLTGLDGVAESL
jgi:isopentenyldiphosphate isomerase